MMSINIKSKQKAGNTKKKTLNVKKNSPEQRDKLKYFREFENEITPEGGANSEDEKKIYNRGLFDKSKK